MNDDQEKQKLWKTYGIILGIMLGGPLIVMGGQSIWYKIQDISIQSTPSPSPSVVDSSISSSNNSTSTSTTQSQSPLTQSEALNIVQGWYNAKPNIFGGSFSRSLVEQYTTGELYYKTLEKREEGSNGSQGWLKDRGCYYTYDFSKIEKVWLFNNSEPRPFLKFQIYEKSELHGSSSAGCGNGGAKSYRKDVTYWFENSNGIWKIYDYALE
jgi:ARC6-like, IMS domain